jgi:hypothetical protein
MATLNEKQAKLFTDRNWGVIATIREDGSPQATPVWIDYDGENVIVSGPAELVEEGALEHIDKLAKKYLGEDRYPYLGPNELRVLIKIRPERVDGFGAGG